jgi:hypothetical protein
MFFPTLAAKIRKMKKFYFLAAFLLVAATSFGQRRTNLQLKHISIPDTMIIKNPNTDAPTIISWSMRNLGPDTVAVSDTLFLRLIPANRTWRLWNRNIQVGDSVTFADTLYFNSGTVNGNFNWCDTLWIKNQANQMLDTTTGNNIICKTIYGKNSTLSIGDVFNSASNKGYNLEIFPNPAFHNISFKYDLKGKDGNVIMRDLLGKVVHQQKLERSSGVRTLEINVQHFPGGIYTVELSGSDYKGIGRVVVQK